MPCNGWSPACSSINADLPVERIGVNGNILIVDDELSMREFLARVKAQLRRVRLIREEISSEIQTPKETL